MLEALVADKVTIRKRNGQAFGTCRRRYSGISSVVERDRHPDRARRRGHPTHERRRGRVIRRRRPGFERPRRNACALPASRSPRRHARHMHSGESAARPDLPSPRNPRPVQLQQRRLVDERRHASTRRDVHDSPRAIAAGVQDRSAAWQAPGERRGDRGRVGGPGFTAKYARSVALPPTTCRSSRLHPRPDADADERSQLSPAHQEPASSSAGPGAGWRGRCAFRWPVVVRTRAPTTCRPTDAAAAADPFGGRERNVASCSPKSTSRSPSGPARRPPRPILLKWCQQLLAERDELVARLRALDAAKHAQEQAQVALTHASRRGPSHLPLIATSTPIGICCSHCWQSSSSSCARVWVAGPLPTPAAQRTFSRHEQCYGVPRAE